jgi:hypothetical protein
MDASIITFNITLHTTYNGKDQITKITDFNAFYNSIANSAVQTARLWNYLPVSITELQSLNFTWKCLNVV